jgi:hypothetical protein
VLPPPNPARFSNALRMPAGKAENRVGEEVAGERSRPQISKVGDHPPPSQLPTEATFSQFSMGVRGRDDPKRTAVPTASSVMKS